MYDKLSCRCKTNDEEKTKVIKDAERKTDAEAKIGDLKMTVEQLSKETQLQLKHAVEDHMVENKGFQATLADQRAAGR